MATRESPYPPPGTVQTSYSAPSQPPPAANPPHMSAPQYGYGGQHQQQQYPPQVQQYGGNGGFAGQQGHGNGGYGGQQGYGDAGYNGQQNQHAGYSGGQASQYYQEAQAAAGQKPNIPPAPQAPQPGLEGKFEDAKPKWNDLWAALLFIAQLGGFIAIAVISLRALPASEGTGGLGNSNGSADTLNASVAWLLSIVCGAGLVFSIGLLALVRAFTKVILEITLALAVIMSVAYAVYLWVSKMWSGAIIFTIFAVLSIIAYPGMRRRIPLSKQLLLFVIAIAKVHKSVYFIALAGTTLLAAYSVFWSISIVAIYQKYAPDAAGSGTSGGEASSATVIGLIVYSLFSYYWTSQFITNLFLTTEAGIFGAFYYGGREATRVAWGAFKRASTYSFGSIAFGSLIVALLDLLRAFFQILMSYARDEGSAIGVAITCCAQCCIGIISNLVSYFNRYAYIEIALYGKPYIGAAKDTWRLFKDRGIDALINDCLVNNIWTFGSYAVGGLCSLIAFAYLQALQPSFIEDNGGLKAVVLGYAFIAGFFICHSLGYGALSSGVSTIFVGLAEDPEVLAIRDPALFSLIQQAYPQVVTSV
ncbi:Pns1p [Rhodotorula paludigena]|uniref:Pns1p n=1 Tax=Rhodotorula paludigena TaxID=86838 RepID=UPI00316C9C7B